MKRFIIIFAALILSASVWAAPLRIDAEFLRPTGFSATKSGTLIATVQADGSTLIIRSTTSGENWDVAYQMENVSDAVLWRGFSAEMRMFFTRDGHLMMSVCSDPDGSISQWSNPVELAKGYCSSSPVVLRNGAVLLPVYLNEENTPAVLFSMNRGDSWTRISSKIELVEKIPTSRPDPILLPYKNGKLLMLNRGTGYQWMWGSVSKDFGRNWSAPEKYIYSPDTHMSVSVLPGGKWLAIKNGRLDQELHYTPDKLIAYMSEDEGETWYGDLILDERVDAVNPCSCAPGDGYIYILYAYCPKDGHCCEVNCVRTSEVEIGAAAGSRQSQAKTKYPVATALGAAATFDKQVAPYLRTKGKPSGSPLNVASFNIEYNNPSQKAPWEERLKYVNELFRGHNFDVVGVQEPFRPEYDQLKETLSDTWDSIFACTDLEKDNFSNSIFYRKERLEMLDSGIFWYTEVPGQAGGFGGSSSRLCLWAKFKDKTCGNIFFVFNSHFDFISYEAMMTSARLLNAKVREIAAGYPAICTGDYNSDDTNPAMKYLAAGPYLKDSMTQAKASVNPEMSSMGRYRSFDEVQRNSYHIDHILFTPGFSRVDRWEILCEQHCGLWGASDHNPINIQWQILK